MKSVLELKVIKSNRNHDKEKCIVCGATVKFYGNEDKKPCQNCGTWVFERKRQSNMRIKEFSCWVCLDKGIVEYPIQKDGRTYKHVARCICPKGMNWPSTIPLLEQCQHAPRAEFIEYKNMETYRKVWDGTQ